MTRQFIEHMTKELIQQITKQFIEHMTKQNDKLEQQGSQKSETMNKL